MRYRAAGVFVAAIIALFGPAAACALADGPMGTDPSSNFVVAALPFACQSDPTGGTCIDAAVNYLDQARASLGQPAYALPADFLSLAPAEQALALTNSDRALYGLAPIAGLSNALNQDAASGVLDDADPQPSDSNWTAYTSNWAGGYGNMVLAYEAWMYDDGPGSGNLDCLTPGASGCWGHRHDILWQFDGGGTLAMGAAAGTDASGSPSYAMLIEQGSIAAGPAGSGGGPAAGDPGTTTISPPAAARTARVPVRIKSLRVRGHRVSIEIAARGGTPLRCSISRRRSDDRSLARSERCSLLATFTRVPAGRYRLRITTPAGALTRRFVVR